MKRLLLPVAGLLCLLGAGCGGPSTCEQPAKSNAQFTAKVEPCRSKLAVDEGAFSLDRCEEATQSCSGEDLESLEGYVACIDRLGTCQPEQYEAWASDYVGCLLSIRTSATCGT